MKMLSNNGDRLANSPPTVAKAHFMQIKPNWSQGGCWKSPVILVARRSQGGLYCSVTGALLIVSAYKYTVIFCGKLLIMHTDFCVS